MSNIYKNIIKFLAPGAAMFFLATLFSGITLAYSIFDLPSPKELAEAGRNLYDKYGLVALLIAALVEGTFMINIYVPGSFVIVLSVYLSDKDLTSLSVIALVTWVGFFLSSIINYWLGATGGYKALLFLGKREILERIKKWMQKNSKRAIFISSVHPNFQALVMVCTGIAHESPLPILLKSASSLLFWVPLWTIFFSQALKHVEIDDDNGAWYVVIMLIVIGFVISFVEFAKQKWLSKDN